MNSKLMMPCRPQRILAALCSLAFLLSAPISSTFGQMPPATQTFPLADVRGLIPKNVDVKAGEYKGRKAVLVTSPAEKDGFVEKVCPL